MDNFWSQVDIRGEDECWPWRGADLYQRQMPARVAWERTFGEVPPGAVVVVDTEYCCNPAHLRTMGKSAFCKTRKPNAKMTAETVAVARKKYATGGFTQKSLSEEFGISAGGMWAILRGKRWPVSS